MHVINHMCCAELPLKINLMHFFSVQLLLIIVTFKDSSYILYSFQYIADILKFKMRHNWIPDIRAKCFGFSYPEKLRLDVDEI